MAGRLGSLVVLLRCLRGRRPAALEDEATGLDERRLHRPGHLLGLAAAHAAKLRVTIGQQPCPAVETDRNAASAWSVVHRMVAVRAGRVRVSLHLSPPLLPPNIGQAPRARTAAVSTRLRAVLEPFPVQEAVRMGVRSPRERQVTSTPPSSDVIVKQPSRSREF